MSSSARLERPLAGAKPIARTSREDWARRKSVPMKRYDTMAEIAGTISFLASDTAGYITGQNIRVDGGLMRGV